MTDEKAEIERQLAQENPQRQSAAGGYLYSRNPRFRKACELLNELFEQTDEDCPQEDRSRHLVSTLEETEQFLVDMGLRHACPDLL